MQMIAPAPLIDLAAALRSGRLDLMHYLQGVLTRIEQIDPQLEALIPEAQRRQRVLAQAEALQRRYPDPAGRPVLYGVPVGIKDIFRADGWPTLAGSALPSELFNGPEAASVRKLQRQGAIVIGKTVTTEFAFTAPGPTRNPHNLNHTPGGSSSGSAAGVAAGLFPLAIGTQTVGSVIRPAAYCGIIGYKPSYGRIDSSGVIHFSPSLDHVGLFTQDVAGMELAASVLCRDWNPAAYAEAAADKSDKLPVLAAVLGPYTEQASEAARQAFEQQITQLEQAGYHVVRAYGLGTIAEITQHHKRLMAHEMAEQHYTWFADHERLYRAETAELIRTGQTISDREADDARALQPDVREDLESHLNAMGADVWVSPAATGTAPEGQSSTGDSSMNLPWTFSGLPTITVPAGRGDQGLPLGLQCSGSYWNDEKLLGWAKGIEQALR